MSDSTKIQWCDVTFNPWIGCAKVSAGCKNCYAEIATPTRVHRKRGLELWGVNAARHITGADSWKKPRQWNRRAQKLGVRLKVFCASLADIFEDRRDLDEPRARLFKLIAETPWLDWLFVTKRPENMRRLAPASWAENWPDNVWAGCTVENQEMANERIPHLLLVPAVVRFLSVEPQLGPIDLHDIVRVEPTCEFHFSALEIDGDVADDAEFGGATIDWVIVGGESGDDARPFNPAWARDLVRQVRSAGKAIFVKQLGANVRSSGVTGPGEHWPEPTKREDIGGGWRIRLKDDHGGEIAEWPEDLKVRQFPPSLFTPAARAQASLFGAGA